MAVIYRISNMANGKYYIGSADSFARREWQHKYDLRRGVHKNPRLQAAWNKYGAEMFVFEVLEEIPEGGSQLQVEDTYLVQHVGRPDCYNINVSAELPRLGLKQSEESKAKTSTNRKGKHAGDQHYRFGQTVSDEVRKKIGDKQRGVPKAPGRVISAEGRLKIAAAAAAGHYASFKGKTHTEATRDKLRRPLIAVLPDQTQREYGSLTEVRDTLGVTIAVIIRACKTGKPIAWGRLAGWCFAYKGEEVRAPQIPEGFLAYPRSRPEAKEKGAPFYFTGIPCSHGHISVRKVQGQCVACEKAKTKAGKETNACKPTPSVL